MKLKYPLIKPEIGGGELEAVKKVLESGYLTEGPITKEFEKEFAKFCETKYAIAFTSCTTGLETALRVLKISRGDEVIVPDFTHPATLNAVYLVGAEPVIVDVEKETYCMDYKEIEKAITSKTKAIMPVSEFGYPLDYNKLNKIKEKYNLFIIEDAAPAIGAERDEKKVGTFADITCFSLHPRKVITCGEGGMNTTNNEEWTKKMSSFKHFGMKIGEEKHKIEFVEKLATNYKLSNILSAIGLEQLKKADKIIARRIKLANNYTELLKSNKFIEIPFTEEKIKHVFQTYCVYIKKKGVRDKIIEEGKEFGIETQIGTYAMSLQPAFAETKKVGDLNVSKDLFENTLALPMSHDLTLQDQEFIIKKINEIINNK